MDLDDIKKMATDLVDEHGDKIKDGIDKVADVADDTTGGKHSEKIDTAAEKAKSAVDKLAGRDDPAP